MTEIGLTPLPCSHLSQIMPLLNLAPDIQQVILFLPKMLRGRGPISSREVIRLAAETDLERQRKRWSSKKN